MRPLHFVDDGKEYAIEFKRKLSDVTLQRIAGGNSVLGPSTYPYTTVDIVEVDKSTSPYTRRVHRTFTVGCHHKDRFNREKGRINALRQVSRTDSLSYEFKAKLWQTYMERANVTDSLEG
jgi:hypothetical protein